MSLSRFFKDLPPLTTKAIQDELERSSFFLDLSRVSEGSEKEVLKLLNNSVLSGGKRLRPMLFFGFCSLFDLDLSRHSEYAKCIEMIHAASLAHDDVIDEADQRRGLESINIQGSNKKAILGGDYLLSEVIETLCRLGRIESVRLTASTIKELSLGEWLQDDCVKTREYSFEKIIKIFSYKTSSVMRWCSTLPALLAGADEKRLSLCHDFGESFGLAFQLGDDLIDDLETSGKTTSLDDKNSQLNAVTWHYLQLERDRFETFQSSGRLDIDRSSQSYQEAKQIVRSETEREIKRSLACLDELKGLVPNPQCLDFIEYLVKKLANRKH